MAMFTISTQSIALASATDGRWHLGIGDPVVIAWVIFIAYFISAWLARTASVACQETAGRLIQFEPREARNQLLLARLWMVVATIMLLLGINKQLDLHALFGETVRNLILQEAWYKDRHRYQVLFTWATVFIGVLTLFMTAYWLRSVMRRALGPLLGLILIGSFVIIRAASFNHVDLVWDVKSMLNSALEFGGICVVGVSALHARRASRQSRNS